MKYVTFFFILMLLSCGEELLKKPDNLIQKGTMVDILGDLALINAIKTNDMSVLQDREIDPTDFIFDKYGVDSLQFVASDRYYASLPEVYEEIYMAVADRMQRGKDSLETAKRVNDSIEAAKKKAAAPRPEK